MVSIIVPLEDKQKRELGDFPWVNWSEVVREYILQRDIFEDFMRSGKLSEQDQKFCEKIDWHPVDWLPLREELIRDLGRARKEPHSKSMTVEEFKKRFGIS
jgi:hypothetical protein